MDRVRHDLAIVGAGPGGYVAALRAAQLGIDVACIEREERLGGTCLRVGCIPTKAMLESSEKYEEARSHLGAHGIQVGSVALDLAALLARKDAVVDGLTQGIALLFKKNKVRRYRGHARFASPGVLRVEGEDAVEIEAKDVVLAPGSRSAVLPGVAPDGRRVGTSTDALAWPEVPRRLVVIGAGYVGLELATVWRRLGARVTVLEYLDRILPGTDLEIAREAQKLLRRQGLEFRLGARVTAAGTEGDEAVVEVEGSEPIRADRVLLAAGRAPATDDLGLDAAGVPRDERGRIAIDDEFRTGVAGIRAIGDAVRGPMLAHKAEEEGIAAVERIAGLPGHVDYGTIPGVAYTDPEIAGVGRTEEDLQAAGVAFRKGIFHFRGNARARCLARIDGRVKVLADAATDRVLGVHILGPRAGDLIAEAVAAMAYGASSEDVARTCHAHPTLSEAVKEAAMAVSGRAIHA